MTKIHLTQNFHLGEFVREEDREHLSATVERNLFGLANRLQVLRDVYFPAGIIISSGYRTKERNALVGGSSESLHMDGLAADIQVPGKSPRDVYSLLNTVWSGGLGIYDGHVHVDLGGQRRWAKRS